jgi:hypothetical protein
MEKVASDAECSLRLAQYGLCRPIILKGLVSHRVIELERITDSSRDERFRATF